ncbi:MAG TPA: nickel pincer cofactor biosynthesis protein LarB [Oligoflexia bacterium]|nr:nickel pincer cofactor biosynthesis protein LarB [Oligoflexia bacterium]
MKTKQDLEALLTALVEGNATVQSVIEKLTSSAFRDGSLGFANLDHHRALRNGFGEVVFGASKTVSEIVTIVRELSLSERTVLVTRLNSEKITACASVLAKENIPVRVRERASTLTAFPKEPILHSEYPNRAFVAVVTAGTSDLGVAEEAIETLIAHEIAFEAIHDVGVAGLHRVLAQVERIRRASAVIVCAGMEGALPSVLGGLVSAPVFAVPTSVGYGASFSGIAALLGMLNSCASGVTVCNIDNGFGAAMAAARVLNTIREVRA